MKRLSRVTIATAVSLWPIAGQTHFATVYNFTGGGPLGLTYSNGVFYGVTGSTSCGTVFDLLPPASSGGAWTQTVLYSFTGVHGDGCAPLEAPIVGTGGALYGVTGSGGQYNGGVAYELGPPASPGGLWVETVIYNFTIGLGMTPPTGPPSNVIPGPNGSLYVTTGDGTYGAGTLFELTPPVVSGGTWTGTTLYTFTGGASGSEPNSLTMGPGGVLYATTVTGGTSLASAGTVFELFPPATQGGVWTGSVLYSFQGQADGADPNGVVLGPNGTLYGTTFGRVGVGANGAGSVFQLTPPASQGGAWTKTILHNFGFSYQCGPDSPLILRNGNLYGATCGSGGGLVFELQAPAISGGPWTFLRLHNFTNGQIPSGAMVMTSTGKLYGATHSPANFPSSGTVYQVMP